MLTAIKAEYNRKTKTYGVKVVEDVHAVGAAIDAGFMVYDDAAGAVEMIDAGRLIGSWPEVKKAAVRAYLASR